MSGACHYCGVQAMTVHGSEFRNSRPKPDPGYRLGYIREARLGSLLICVTCFVNKLPANVTA